jgi:hypothetical protein
MLKLVYGCLAVSLIACIFLFVAASGNQDGFHGTTKVMSDALVQGATVLDADAHGAVTQTGNGRIRGYVRGGGEQWSTSFDPFEEGPTNPYGAGQIEAHAWCTGSCPNAITQIDGAFTDHGNAGARLAAKLTSMQLTDKSILALTLPNVALVTTGTPPNQKLLSVLNDSVTDVGVANPSVATVDRNYDHAIVGSARGNVGFLTRLTWESGKEWKILEPRLREVGLRNSCLSDNGISAGMVANRVRQFEFFKQPGHSLGPAVGSGTCSIDNEGVTAIYTQLTNTAQLESARYSTTGKRVWLHKFAGGERLISGSSSAYVVVQGQGGLVTALDSVTGRIAFQKHINGVPFVARDGSIVTANRKGEPQWLFAGKPVGG